MTADRAALERPRPVRRARHVLLSGVFLLPTAAGAATLTVELTGVENDHGLVRGAVCTPETFATKRCPFSGASPAWLGPPRFEDAAIDVAEPSTSTRVRLRRIGP